MGLDVRNLVQSYVVGMDRSLLLEGFGPRLSFNGCIGIQRFFSFSMLEEIRLEAKMTVDALGYGGDYLLVPIHFVQSDATP